MNEAKHTPGQWFINRESSDCHDGKLSIEVDGDYFIAQVDEGFCQEPNALLIASAPELLEALQGLEEAYCRSGTSLTRDERTKDRKRLIAARAAIAKATGGAA